MTDYGTYKPPKSPTTGRANPPKSPSLCVSLLFLSLVSSPYPLCRARAAPPPLPKSPSGARKSSVASDEPPRSPRGSARPPQEASVPAPATSWGGTAESRYEPLVGNDSEGDSGCPNCGTAYRPNARYCDSCGHSLKGQTKAAALFSTSDWAFDPSRYGLFGWIETILGVIGLAMGFGSLYAFQSPGMDLTPLRIAEAVMIGLSLAVFVLLLAQRFFYKELFAFVYAALAMGGGVCALIVVLLHSARPGSFFIVYFFAWFSAMVVKLFWLCCADFGPMARFRLEQHVLLDSRMKIALVTCFMAFVNLIGFIIQLYILTSTFDEQ